MHGPRSGPTPFLHPHTGNLEPNLARLPPGWHPTLRYQTITVAIESSTLTEVIRWLRDNSHPVPLPAPLAQLLPVAPVSLPGPVARTLPVSPPSLPLLRHGLPSTAFPPSLPPPICFSPCNSSRARTPFSSTQPTPAPHHQHRRPRAISGCLSPGPCVPILPSLSLFSCRFAASNPPIGPPVSSLSFFSRPSSSQNFSRPLIGRA